ncbi:hypothetical protein M513_11301 [Trichuris suis]|nr:hypothetical protein M513_11301 [Trichuris suis]
MLMVMVLSVRLMTAWGPKYNGTSPCGLGATCKNTCVHSFRDLLINGARMLDLRATGLSRCMELLSLFAKLNGSSLASFAVRSKNCPGRRSEDP